MKGVTEGSNKTKEEDNKGGRREWKRSSASIFRHADSIDYCLMAFGFLGAVGDGLTLPIALIIYSHMFNEIGSSSTSPNFTRNITHNANLIIYLAMASFVSSYLEGYCWTRTGERQTSRMRARYLHAVLQQNETNFNMKVASTTQVVNGISNDSMVIQDFVSEKVPNIIMNFTLFFGVYIEAFIYLWRLALVIFPTGSLLIIPGLIVGRVMLTLARKILIEYNKAGLIAEQAISSIRTVYAFRAERCTTYAFSTSLQSSLNMGLNQGLAKSLALGCSSITYLIWALIVWYNGRLVLYHGAKGGTALSTGMGIVMGCISLGSSLSNIKYYGEAVAAAERINETIMNRPVIDSESVEGEQMEEIRGEVEFRDVRFKYPTRPETEVIAGFNLVLPAGKTVALIGESGSGKSTMIALLQRFNDPTGGEILLDGVDIRRLKLKWFRGQMGLVSQEPALFATSIKENILFGKEDATMEEVMVAAKAANADGFISQLPLGYDTQVGENGVQLSGGQKQRIAIARAIVRSPKILLLDEATSALDYKSELVVQAALDAAAIGRTTIVVAHRLSTIRNADIIAFIQAGKVMESGSHEELTSNINSRYSSLITLQESQPFSETVESNADTKIIYDSPAITRARNRTATNSLSYSLSPNHEPLSFSSSKWSVNKENDVQDLKLKLAVPSFWSLFMLNAPEWRQAILGCTGALLIGAMQPNFWYTIGTMTSVYFLKDHDEMKEKIRTYSLLLVALSVACFLINIMQHYNIAAMGEYLTKRIRERMLSKILTFEVGWFDQDENSTGSICSQLAKDANIVRSLVGDRMALIIQTVSAMTVAATMGLLIAWRLAIVIISLQPVIIISFYTRFVLLKKTSKKTLKAQVESSKLVADAINNLQTIAAFSSQDRILDLFKLAQLGPRSDSIHQSRVAGVGLGLSNCISLCSVAFNFWYGCLLISNGSVTTKEFMQIFPILMGTGRVIAEAGALTSDLSNGLSTIASIFVILNRSTLIDPDNPKGCQVESINGEIELHNVDYAYPTRPNVPILKQFSLSIKAGRSTALVGPSGSGKSTIISLIERFYDPLHGVIHIDGKDIRSYNLHSLRQHIALVGQEPVLFAGTVKENITYGMEQEPNSTEIEAAARAANAQDFICSLPNGYQTSCGEHGLQLSGGQKQRIAIARAILRNPRILLLDEATSALDRKSELVVQEALYKVMVGRTTIVVAHRLSTVENCDVIAVLEEGVLVEKGSHASLMKKGPTGKYYGLVSLQRKSDNQQKE
ncbi:hypothetical protein IEQ34_013111 [Dendrobium chrysotoxum]|uniref:Uncharacterized protein n=1 Tax=Dendrobium chrysotoxum TaxID=161865 RepID=A0AAV7GMK9_DENCH|nr:hypothetical protein IEQ34_013111 [Dendrobium chrysotoxum]